MTDYREILRMTDKGLSLHAIAAALGCSRNTVRRVVRAAAQQQLSWSSVSSESLSNAELAQRLFQTSRKTAPNQLQPDMEYLSSELRKEGVTLTILWTEYCQTCLAASKKPLMYSQFCHHFRQYSMASPATMHLTHRPAERMEVDWAGAHAYLQNRATGEMVSVSIFIAVLSYSQYTYAEAFPDERLESWISGNIHALEAFGGVPKAIVPDNLKTGVTSADRHAPQIQRNYQEMAEHYNTVILPARIRAPRDKATVESGVDKFVNRLLGQIRNQIFFELSQLNDAIREYLAIYNSHPFQKKQGSRASMLQEEQPLLAPLPKVPFELAFWKQATVQFNYHIALDSMYYSVPYQYIKQVVDVKSTSQLVEVYVNGARIASHRRRFGHAGQYATEPTHMPAKHQTYLVWNDQRFLDWAIQIGPATEQTVRGILSRSAISQQAYRACMGLLNKAKRYGSLKLERCCALALAMTDIPSYKLIDRLLKQPVSPADLQMEQQHKQAHLNEHSFLRHSKGGLTQ